MLVGMEDPLLLSLSFAGQKGRRQESAKVAFILDPLDWDEMELKLPI